MFTPNDDGTVLGLPAPLSNGLHTPPDFDAGVSSNKEILSEIPIYSPLTVDAQSGRTDLEYDSLHQSSVPSPKEKSSQGMDGQSILFTMQGFTLPEMQEAVITANMRSTLNLQKTSIPVKRPVLGEVVVRVSWTGICRSVRSDFSICIIKNHNHPALYPALPKLAASHTCRMCVSLLARNQGFQNMTTSQVTKASATSFKASTLVSLGDLWQCGILPNLVAHATCA